MGGGPPRGRRPFAWLFFDDRFSLLGVKNAEQSGEIIVRTRGAAELIGVAVRAGTVCKRNSLELVNVNHFSAIVAQDPDKSAGDGIIGVAGAGIDLVRDQQRVAYHTEMVWRDSETPRLIQIATVREVLQEGSVFDEVINVTTDSTGVGCE
jgi:hypothetical protein